MIVQETELINYENAQFPVLSYDSNCSTDFNLADYYGCCPIFSYFRTIINNLNYNY